MMSDSCYAEDRRADVIHLSLVLGSKLAETCDVPTHQLRLALLLKLLFTSQFYRDMLRKIALTLPMPYFNEVFEGIVLKQI